MSEFGDRPFEQLNEIDRMSIEAIGITFDYRNELLYNPDDEKSIDVFIDSCLQGIPKTYTERFANHPEMIVASDPDKVAKIDQLMTEAREAAKVGDRDTIKARIREMKIFLK